MSDPLISLLFYLKISTLQHLRVYMIDLGLLIVNIHLTHVTYLLTSSSHITIQRIDIEEVS